MGFSEQAISESVDPKRLSDTLKEVAARPHHAGSDADLATAKYLHEQFIIAGLESRIEEYEVLLPWPEEVTVEMLAPHAYRCAMREEPLDQDFDTHTREALPPHLAYSPDGDVIGHLVYVNLARESDFAELKKRGVKLEGAVGIARYGALFRGSKLRNAAACGMAALLLYSDPKDDGFARGDTYPDGPWRPESAVQRGSVLDIARYPGDPLTPGEPALANARRRDLGDVDTIPAIPGAPLSARDARPLLESLKGANVPEGWQGALPFPYHVGGTEEVSVRVRVRSDWRIRKIWNVVASLRGFLFPEEEVIVGNHRDAWVHGAVDPGSGTAVMLEAARVLGDLARNGRRPARSIVFCSFDGEEYGMLGSMEHVEHFRSRLLERAIMYVNVDAAVSGPNLGARGSPELSLMLNGALSGVRDDRSDRRLSLLDATGPQALQTPGGGSDFVPFLHRLALPVLDIASSGPYGVYHSGFDTYTWMKKHGDPGFSTHARMSRLLAVLLNRIASCTVLPMDYISLADWMKEHLPAIPAPAGTSDQRSLRDAVLALREAALAMDASRASLVESDPDPLRLRAVNRASWQALRVLRADGLLPERPFFAHALVATDQRDGYGALTFPSIRSALADGDVERAREAEARIVAIIDDLILSLTRITEAMNTLAEPAQ